MKKETIKNTTNSAVYKKRLTWQLGSKYGLCHYCSPHGGCNYWNSRHIERNWKKYRNTQWQE